MKRNIWLVGKDGSHFVGRTVLTSVSGGSTLFNPFDSDEGIDHTEDDLIQRIDEEKMSPKKLLATRFLTFLGNQRLTLEELKLLPKEEQQRLKKEFLENN